MKYCPTRNSFSVSPLVLAIAAAYACIPVAHAKENSPEKTLATVQVIGGEENLPTLGGAGQILGKKELEDSHVFTVNEALRKVPGVHARDEEGFGLRPNIAMRGLNPTRSPKSPCSKMACRWPMPPMATTPATTTRWWIATNASKC